MEELFKKPGSTVAFFARFPVFTVKMFSDYLQAIGRPHGENLKRLLGYHKKQGRIISIRPGLYASVPSFSSPVTFQPDPILIAANLTEDAVIAYHTALELHGIAQSVSSEATVLSNHHLARPLTFQHVTYQTVSVPRNLTRSNSDRFEVISLERQGLNIQVTSLERTLVDVLDRLALSGGWEEIQRSFELIPYIDVDTVAQYVTRLGNKTTAAKVGYFLEANARRWMVKAEVLNAIRSEIPQRPQYADRQHRQNAHLVPKWNILLPESVVSQNWEETDEPFA